MKRPLDAVGTAGPQGKITTREFDRPNFPLPTSNFRAQLITCADCHELFTWSAKEQEFFAAQGFQPPKRCRPCRGKKRERFTRRTF